MKLKGLLSGLMLLAMVGVVWGQVHITPSRYASVITNANSTTAADMFPLFSATQGGNYAALTNASLKFNPSTGLLTSPGFSGPLTGAVTGTVSGNSGTVTNGVYTNGSYADPSWLTSLNATKLATGTGAVTVAAGGTAQNVTITPSTTGHTILNGTVDLPGVSNIATIATGTTDGADGNILGLAGGGTRGATRGAYIDISGNEVNSGGITVVGGAAGGDIVFNIGAAGGETLKLIGASNIVKMALYGAGTATFDASGNISSVSDERMKIIQGKYTAGLKELMGIEPINYKWNKKSGMETKHTYAGFSAQNIQKVMPDAVYANKEGTLSFNDRAILAAAVNAIKELNAKVIGLKAKVKRLEAKVQ